MIIHQSSKNLKIRYLIIGIMGLILLFLVFKFFAPFGAIVQYRYTFNNNPDMMSELKPIYTTTFFTKKGDNVVQITSQVIKQNKVYFDLKIPAKGFNEAIAKVRFQSGNSEFLIGLKGTEKDDFIYRSLDNKILDNIKWGKLESGDTVLYQLQPNFKSVEDFQKNLPKDNIIAQYYYNILTDVKIPNYEKSDKTTNIDVTLRGSHTFYTYIKDEALELTFQKQDLNFYEGPHTLTVNVYKGDKKIESKVVDVGKTNEGSKISEPQEVKIKINNLEEGVYKIEVLQDDSVIKNITTKQKFLVISDNVFLADNEIYKVSKTKPNTLYTKSKKMTVVALHKQGFQKLLVNDKEITIDEVDKKYDINLTKDLSKVTSPVNDISMYSDGEYFSFTPDSYFNPLPYKIVSLPRNNEDLTKVQYIIARYNTPTSKEGWFENEVKFDMSKIDLKEGVLYFVLEAPGLKETNGAIKLDKLEITLKKSGIF